MSCKNASSITTKPSDNVFSVKISKVFVPSIQRSILKTMKTLLKLFIAVATFTLPSEVQDQIIFRSKKEHVIKQQIAHK